MIWKQGIFWLEHNVVRPLRVIVSEAEISRNKEEECNNAQRN